jgi:regulatory protein
MKTKVITAEQAIIRLETLCCNSEHCTYELYQKLYKWGISAEESSQIIKSLLQRRFVDDKRFTRSFVNDKFNFAHWGKRKIAMALYTKRIDRQVIAEALDTIDEEAYRNLAKELCLTKSRTIEEPQTFEGRTKLFRFLISRGFEPDIASRTVKELSF